MRVSYWTTACLEPQIEAVSKEVFDLVDGFPSSRVLAVSPHLRFRVERRGRVLGVHPVASSFLRPMIRLSESWGDVNHVYAEIAPWVFFSALRRRPIVLTIASEKGDPVPEYLRRCSVIAVQTEGMLKRLESLPEAAGRVRLVYPGIDLTAFPNRPRSGVRDRPHVLLATFPRAAEELHERGVAFLLDAAAALPGIDFTLVSRPWRSGSTALEVVRAQVAERALGNVRILSGLQGDMASLYADADFTVIPFATASGGKECPRSLVESMACGVPVLISDVAPFSSYIRRQGAGLTFSLEPQSFAAAIERGLAGYSTLSKAAGQSVREHFDVHRTRDTYHALYGHVLRDGQ